MDSQGKEGRGRAETPVLWEDRPRAVRFGLGSGVARLGQGASVKEAKVCLNNVRVEKALGVERIV